MIKEVLGELGLDQKEVDIYLHLLRFGASRASTIAYQLKLPRTTVQNILLRLEKEELVTKTLDKNVAVFAPVSPDSLAQLMEIKKRQKMAEFDSVVADLKRITPDLNSIMNIDKNMPSVKLYKGRDAVRKILFDTLTSKTELKDFANIDAMFKYVRDINDEYVVEREKTKVTKRSLLLDTPFARKIYESGECSPKSHKGYKWIKNNLYPFSLEMNIYDGKVSYITYVEDDFVGVIIENEHIYKMHDSMWNLIWDLS